MNTEKIVPKNFIPFRFPLDTMIGFNLEDGFELFKRIHKEKMQEMKGEVVDVEYTDISDQKYLPEGKK